MSVTDTTAPPTWAEIRQKVRDVRAHFSKGLRITPSYITFREINETTRVYFVSELHKRDTSLLYVDLPSPYPAPPWNPLLEAGFQSLPSNVSKEERLMWERKKVSSWGITCYNIHLPTGRIIFPAGGSLYYCVDNATSQSVFPYEIQTKSVGARLNATMCPHNPDLVAFVNSGDIWLVNLETRQEERLTYCHNSGAERVSEDPLSAGLPSYVMQEEFNRYTGFWWRPETSTSKQNRSYSLLYEELDEKNVEIVRILGFPSNSAEAKPDVEEFRYPRAESPNPISTLKLVNFTLGPSKEILDCCHFELSTCLKVLFPWYEYLVRAGWTPDGQHVWVQLLDRSQQRLELVLIPKNQFVRVTFPKVVSCNGSDYSRDQAPFQVVTVEQSETWINVDDILKFIPHSDSNQVKFLWASEETGYRHLYLVVATISNNSRDNSSPDAYHTPRIVSRIQLTYGKWEVINRQVWYDHTHQLENITETRDLVYFHGLMDCVLEPHLYVVSLRRPGEVRRLTNLGLSHSVEMRWLLRPSPPDEEYPPPELFSHTITSGEEIYGLLYKPSVLRPGVKYPVMLNIYGGPELQMVGNSFKGLRELRSHLLASHGYVVVCIDNRGSLHRGVNWEAHIRGKLGQVELADQVEVLHWLADITGYLDLSRVGIHGWSYGGYLSLMALVQYPSEFKVAIAGAPVTSWECYDTGMDIFTKNQSPMLNLFQSYTERYMETPSSNPAAYKFGSLLNFVDQFPEEEGRLLIMHGTMDENVHFMQHTAQFINLLIKHGKPYQLQVYPGERHSLRLPDSNEHYLTTLLSFLNRNL